MCRNYAREFSGQERMANKNANLMVGDLINPYNKYVLTQPEVDQFNRFTDAYNRTNYRDAQEFYLDQRHKFFITRGDLKTLPRHALVLLIREDTPKEEIDDAIERLIRRDEAKSMFEAA